MFCGSRRILSVSERQIRDRLHADSVQGHQRRLRRGSHHQGDSDVGTRCPNTAGSRSGNQLLPAAEALPRLRATLQPPGIQHGTLRHLRSEHHLHHFRRGAPNYCNLPNLNQISIKSRSNCYQTDMKWWINSCWNGRVTLTPGTVPRAHPVEEGTFRGGDCDASPAPATSAGRAAPGPSDPGSEFQRKVQ